MKQLRRYFALKSAFPAGRGTAVILAMLLGLAGCASKDRQSTQLEWQSQQLQQQLVKSQQTIAEKQIIINQQNQQIATLSALGPERLKVLFTVEKIELGRYTGGTNLDDQPGDDGVRVYVIPQDQEGRTITAAGAIEVGVYDLGQEDQPLLGSYSFEPAEAKKLWQAGALADHYNITCPWQKSPPSGNEVTIRVKFTDYLTGKVLTAARQCRISVSEASTNAGESKTKPD